MLRGGSRAVHALLIGVSILAPVAGVFQGKHSAQEFIQSELAETGEQLREEVERDLNYTEEYMREVATAVAAHGAGDLHFIARLLKDAKADPKLSDLLSWSALSWADKSNHVRATGNGGVLKSPLDIRARQYTRMGRQNPWKLLIDRRAPGAVTTLWILPGGMGVTDDEGEFLGFVTLGFDVNSLQRVLSQQVRNHSIDFALYHSGDETDITGGAIPFGEHELTLPVKGSAMKLTASYKDAAADALIGREMLQGFFNALLFSIVTMMISGWLKIKNDYRAARDHMQRTVPLVENLIGILSIQRMRSSGQEREVLDGVVQELHTLRSEAAKSGIKAAKTNLVLLKND